MQRANFLRLGAAAAIWPWLPSCSPGRTRFAALSVGLQDTRLATAGYGHFELSVVRDLMPDKTEAEFDSHLKVLQELQIPCRFMNNFIDPKLRLVGPDVDSTRSMAWSRIAFQRAARAGVRIVTIGAGRSRKVPDGFEVARAREQFTTFLAGILPMARDVGVTLAIENLNSRETNLGNTLAECLSLVEATGSELGLTVDLYHMMRESELPSALGAVLPRMVHCHVAEHARRTPPGTVGDDFRPFLRVLREGDYSGAFTFECGWGSDTASPTAALASFREQLHTC